MNFTTHVMLITHALEFSYNRVNSFKFPDIVCKQGSHWLITGPSGCGKTTLLHLLSGLIRPHKGQVIIADSDISRLKRAAMDQFRGKNIGIIFQKPYFVHSLTVAENIKVARFLNHLAVSDSEIEEVLRKLNIGEKFHSKPKALSQGELQRLSMARALVNNPSVILADEPTSSLDDKHCHEALQLLKEQAERERATLIIVTHDQRLKSYFSNIIQLNTAKR